jgi:NAD(P)-dependent dehydrogenase (short-subunit alcohol dehydrogenase family)
LAESDQRVAVVSGASRGIGAEIARQLAGDHGFLVFAGTRSASGAASSASPAGATTTLVPILLDVTDQRTIDAARDRIESDPGRLDVLVNNAGIGYPYSATAADTDLDEARQVLETNLFGAWRLTQAMLPLLRDSDDARIVNVSSGAGQLSEMNGGYPAYRMSKSALNALTRVLSNEEPEIRTNSLCPGWVRTDMGGSGAPRSIEEGADTAVWLATRPDGGPTGGFFRDRKPIPW